MKIADLNFYPFILLCQELMTKFQDYHFSTMYLNDYGEFTISKSPFDKRAEYEVFLQVLNPAHKHFASGLTPLDIEQFKTETKTITISITATSEQFGSEITVNQQDFDNDNFIQTLKDITGTVLPSAGKTEQEGFDLAESTIRKLVEEKFQPYIIEIKDL